MNSNPHKIMSREKIDLILETGFPNDSELSQFPLGDLLLILEKRAWTRGMRAIDFNNDEMTNIFPSIENRDNKIKEIESFEKDVARMKAADEKRSIIDRIIQLRKDVDSLSQNIDEQVRNAHKMLAQENISEIYFCHIRNAVAGVRMLTTMKPNDSIDDRIVVKADFKKEHIRNFNSFLCNMDSNTRKFLRLVALYHDIGKVYHRDRHPVLGKHLLESLNEENRRDFLGLFKGEEDSFYQMLELVGHHDVFGMLCTGEASRTSLIDSSSLRLSDVEISEKLIDGLVILNLGDIYGSIGMIPEERIDMIISDWAYFKRILQESKSKHLSKRQIEENIIENEQEPEMTAERIKRLLISMIMYGNKVRTESQKASFDRSAILERISSDDIIRSALVKQLGSSISTFCSDFALVCKLDYMLRFLNMLADEWLIHCGKEYSKGENSQTNTIELDLSSTMTVLCIENLAVILIEILNRLVCGYSDLTRTRDDRRRRIGLELMGLSRSRDIGKRVIELIIGGIRAEGMNWVADEATCWYLS